jgi:hypothetical protein
MGIFSHCCSWMRTAPFPFAAFALMAGSTCLSAEDSAVLEITEFDPVAETVEATPDVAPEEADETSSKLEDWLGKRLGLSNAEVFILLLESFSVEEQVLLGELLGSGALDRLIGLLPIPESEAFVGAVASETDTIEEAVPLSDEAPMADLAQVAESDQAEGNEDPEPAAESTTEAPPAVHEILLGAVETIEVMATDDLQLRVTIYGTSTELFRGSLAAGQNRRFFTEKVLLFTTDNAAALTLRFKGQNYTLDREGPVRILFPAIE